MNKKKKVLTIAGITIVAVVIIVIVLIRYVPWHKLMKIPTSSETAFINKDILTNRAPNALSFDFEVDSTQDTPNGIYKGIAHSGKYSAKVFGKNTFSVGVVR